ncbi:trimeric intracellular cation channel family protein [Alisedimentitalea sp. MJ-SS2]|uniref:trimeric intracellular cation channel family protein n=1 Tax=Aliisedimentitalea sp. MJ-SS2 TaxID=3049795 RepID=UPI0029088A68|nr:trimeric intracellular cation channel family protein [Alisedimentitalea sp. MJ-SS2]MDU8929503.1 trimeric intracellular cation channel family protein [Alisedimentitalea sp. MJ-SS2]
MSAVAALDYVSVLIFALTGALVASRAQLDIVGFAFVACLTAVGGGTVRDVLLDRNPVFWVGEPTYILIAALAAVVVFFTAHLMESRYRWLLWLDSFALAVAVPAGVSLAMETGQNAAVVLIMGMVTGCMGGLLRDVVVGEVPLVLKQGELYATAALAGAGTALVVSAMAGAVAAALVGCGVVTWALRAGSMAFGWKLPVYRARPPKS